jgi:formate dehydrogenase major subunit
MREKDDRKPVSRRRFLTFSGIGTTALAVGLVARCGGDKKKDELPGDDVLDAIGADIDEDIGIDTPMGDDVPVDAGKDHIEDNGPDTELDLTPDAELDSTDDEFVQSMCPVMPAYEDTREVKVGTETTTICPYCGCGCGLVVTTVDGKVTNTEGDPDHPINEGALCSKGQSLYQVANNERRMTKVLHRSPGAADWEEVTWDEALDGIAAKVKATRDATFMEQDGDGRTVNRTEGIGLLGSAALDNEECYALSKMARALGLVYIEHQARI